VVNNHRLTKSKTLADNHVHEIRCPLPDATHHDVIVGHPVLSDGHITFTIPGTAAILITF
jgi:hypothetical protein